MILEKAATKLRPPWGSSGLCRVLAFTALWLLCPPLMHEARAAGVDAILLMNSTTSMKRSDPDRIRVEAAQRFMLLLGEADRVGLISYSDKGYPVLRPTDATAKYRTRVLAAAEQVSARGLHGNIHAALTAGLEMLDKYGLASQQRVLVLLTDGKLDVGQAGENERLLTAVRETLIPKLRETATRVYSIGLSGAADVDLLREIADQTGGEFRLSRDDEELPGAYTAIFEAIVQPLILPIAAGVFTLDESVRSVTLVTHHDTGDQGKTLYEPGDRRVGQSRRSEGVEFYPGEEVDVYKIADPLPGVWKLVPADRRDRGYLTTDVRLAFSPIADRQSANSAINIEVWFERYGRPVAAAEVPDNTIFEVLVETPDGARSATPLLDNGENGDREAADGRYSNQLRFEHQGTYHLVLRTTTGPVRRQHRMALQAIEPLPPPVRNDLAPSPSFVGPPEEIRRDAVAATGTKTPDAPPGASTGSPAEPTPAADGEQTGEGPDATAEPKKKPGLLLVGGIFLGINLVLGLVGGGVWWFLKKRKARPAAEDEEDSETEPEPGPKPKSKPEPKAEPEPESEPKPDPET